MLPPRSGVTFHFIIIIQQKSTQESYSDRNLLIKFWLFCQTLEISFFCHSRPPTVPVFNGTCLSKLVMFHNENKLSFCDIWKDSIVLKSSESYFIQMLQLINDYLPRCSLFPATTKNSFCKVQIRKLFYCPESPWEMI